MALKHIVLGFSVSLALASAPMLLQTGCSSSLRRGIADIVLDVACIVRNAELADGERERMCAVPPEKTEEAHKIASATREESRRFAAQKISTSHCGDAGK